MPNVLPIEAMGQAAGVFMLTSANLGNQIADFMSCDKIKFRQTVTLGDQLKTHAKLIKRKGGTIGVEETAHRVEDKAISSAQLMFIFVGIRK
jgi:UDP-3-O-[3-hydroxymyristoyl] N-acetylglucosamine deacetylase/3-hydroxyacyl-[acyl-carrier-protein] dehydratase